MIKFNTFIPRHKNLKMNMTQHLKANTLKFGIYNIGFAHIVLKMLRDFKNNFYF